jgi:hypothetical protein
MNSQKFALEIKQGKLIIPAEIEDYLSKCSDNTKVSLIIKSELNLVNNWNQWFEEVEEIEPLNNNNNELNDYAQLLIDKYKKQGLKL